MDRRLLDYLPPILQPVRELRAICEGQRTVLEDVWAAVEAALDDQFIEDARESGIARREKILSITPKGTDTLEDRRFRVKARMNERLPFTLPALRQQMADLCGPDGYTVSMDQGTYLLTVRVALTAKSNFDDVGALLRRVAPANIIIDLELKYNQYGTLEGFTHGQLSRWTHDQLRNEVLT